MPAIADRLKGGKGKRGGFDADHVEREVAGAKGMQTIEGTAAPAGGDGGPSGQDAPGAAGPASQGAALPLADLAAMYPPPEGSV